MSRSLSTLAAIVFAVAAHAQTLAVAAASDLTDAEPALTSSFHQIAPQVKLQFINAASGVLTQQIENGAPYDVFLSANAAFINRLSASGKVESGSIRVYAIGRLGMLWRDGKSHPLGDLQVPWVRFVSIPNPQLAPYGVAAEQAIRHLGIWDSIKSKIVYGENVRQTLQQFASGNSDVVLTADSLLQGRNAQLIPLNWHQPIVQKAAIVKPSAAASQFLDFLASRQAQAVFSRFGLSPPSQ